jgi:hypothetical protein
MGDRAKAREEVETALAIDPEFLAARMLRDELDTPDTPAIPTAAAPPIAAAAVIPTPAPSSSASPASLAASAAKLAEFEERVKERVRTRSQAQTRANTAASSTPRSPLTAPPSRSMTRYRWSALAIAAASFAFAVLTSRTQAPPTLQARGSIAVGSVVDAPDSDTIAPQPPRADEVIQREEAAALAVERPYIRPRPSRVLVEETAAQSRVIAATTPVPSRSPALLPLPAIVPPIPPAPVQAAPASATVVTDSPPPAVVPRPVDDRAMVEETLSRYRRAYNRQDARSAQAVYPNLNAPALARAFDSLQSQSLQFDECEIDVRGGSANVTCRGTSRYVPKVGNRDAHVEPRVWDFLLRKDAGDWKIENARASR